MYQHLQIQSEGRLTTLTLQRPERHNALHGPLWEELRKAALQFFDRPPGALIITGAAPSFCAGMDLNMDNPLIGRLMPAVLNKDRTKLRELILELKAVFNSIARLNCPIIAAIEGVCSGGGLELALACDIRVASIEAKFSLPETRFGMMPDVGGTVRLVRLIGQSRASDMILTGRQVEADEAQTLGIVNRLCPPGHAVETASQVARSILAGSPAATRQALLTLRKAPGLPDEQAFDWETEAGARAVTSGEVMEGLKAFAEKRSPSWVD